MIRVSVFESITGDKSKLYVVRSFLEKEGIEYEETYTGGKGARLRINAEMPFKVFKRLYKENADLFGNVLL